MHNQSHALLLTGVAICAALLLISGCIGTGQSPPSRFYLLSSIEPDNPSSAAGSEKDEISIGLGPLRFPLYLKRKQIVTRTGPNEIQLSEFDRWAEPLETNFAAVLRENLSILLNTAKILSPPWPKEAGLEFEVVADVSRFDAEPGRQAVLTVRWAVIRFRDEQLLLVKKSTYAKPLRSGGFKEMVQAQSLIVADFSREIAAAVQNLYRLEHGQ